MKRLSILVIVLILVVACNTQQQPKQYPTVESSINQEVSTNSSYPDGYPSGSKPTYTEPYPASNQTEELTRSEQNETLEIPDTSINNATVHGVILDALTQQAPSESVLYLGIIQETDKGLPVIALDRELAPVATLLKNGKFMFTDIPPGTYGIILFNPDVSFLLDDPQNTIQSMEFTVDAGEALDLGVLEIILP